MRRVQQGRGRAAGRRLVAALGGAVAAVVALAGCSVNSAGDQYPPLAAADKAGSGEPVFQDHGVNPHTDTSHNNRSTFALDVDTGSYTITRGWLQDGSLPEPSSVRTEEFVNYYPQDYPVPDAGMGIHVDGTPAPFLTEPDAGVLRVGLQAAAVAPADREPVNLTFVVDVSGSMEGWKMEMVTSAMYRLVDALRPDDAVAIVAFDDQARLVLPMTGMGHAAEVRAGLGALTPGGSTNLEKGLRMGYDHARSHLRTDGLNRVVLLSDGAANQGQTDPERLAQQIAQEAGDHTQLVVIGVGRDTYDEVVLEQFADQGNGFYAYLDSIREAERLRLRQDILVAAFAENLRDAPWAELVDLAQLADLAQALHHSVEHDQHLAELAELTGLAYALAS